jgi:hypothetical protein
VVRAWLREKAGPPTTRKPPPCQPLRCSTMAVMPERMRHRACGLDRLPIGKNAEAPEAPEAGRWPRLPPGGNDMKGGCRSHCEAPGVPLGRGLSGRWPSRSLAACVARCSMSAKRPGLNRHRQSQDRRPQDLRPRVSNVLVLVLVNAVASWS